MRELFYLSPSTISGLHIERIGALAREQVRYGKHFPPIRPSSAYVLVL